MASGHPCCLILNKLLVKLWFRPANPAGEGYVPGSVLRQGVQQPPLSLDPPPAIPRALHLCVPTCLRVTALETRAVLSASCSKSILMVQGGLCVISHYLGEENTPKYLRAIKTYKNVLGKWYMSWTWRRRVAKRVNLPNQFLPLFYVAVWMSSNCFELFVSGTVLFHNQCQANFYPFLIYFFV